MQNRYTALTLALLACIGGTPAHAFPPYRSTDAATADPDTLEIRLGLGSLEVDEGKTSVTTPLLRVNVGLSKGLEFTTEAEYEPSDGVLGDGAAGLKWVPFEGAISVGVETLALLPVQRGHSGVGVESQLVATYRTDDVRFHVNGGGFTDPRGNQTETGWRASGLVELVRTDSRTGFEVFAKKVNHQAIDARAGVGVIYDVGGGFDLRSAVHVGVTRGAPDAIISFWISRTFSLESLF